jgi:hypothetical protein
MFIIWHVLMPSEYFFHLQVHSIVSLPVYIALLPYRSNTAEFFNSRSQVRTTCDFPLSFLPVLVCSIFRLSSESEALEQFNFFSFKLQALLSSTGNKLLTRDRLQQISDAFKTNPGWTCAHVAVKLGLLECLDSEVVTQLVQFSILLLLLCCLVMFSP